jgi:ornithine cyclodeaminase
MFPNAYASGITTSNLQPQAIKSMLLLNRSELQQILTEESVIEVVEDGFRAHQKGETISPLRMHVDLKETSGIYLLMPSYHNSGSAFGSKILSLYAANPTKNKPTISSMYLLCDGEDGSFQAMMDGGCITGMRTAAASAVASKYLARPDAKVQGIIGTGTQAMFQAAAIATACPCERLIVYNRHRDKAVQFAEQAALRMGIPVDVAASVGEVGQQADIITTVTSSTTPVLGLSDVRPGCHINAVGAFKPKMQEIGADLIKAARVVVDSLEACLAETGDLLVPMDNGSYSAEEIHGELGDLLLGNISGRVSDDEITLFESVGISFEDLVTAQLACTRARERNIGSEIDLTL